jgi:hypothetical protein
MKVVKVTYTTKPEYSAQNQENIKNVMKDLQKLAHPGLFYHACMAEDGKTFIHTGFFNSDEANQVLVGLPAFKHFQEQLKAHGPEAPPKQEVLSFVEASGSIF